MKEVTVVSDGNVPLARKRKSSTSDAADGGKKKKTEGGASKKTTAALEAEKRKVIGIPFAKAPKHPHLCKLLILRHCLFICLAPVLMHFARFRKKATTSLKNTSKTLGTSRNIKDMLHSDASPAIAPTTPAVKPSSSLTSSQAKEASGPSAMEVDS